MTMRLDPARVISHAALALGLAVAARAQTPAAGERWVATWGTAQQLYQAPPAPARATPPAGAPQTVPAQAAPPPAPRPGAPARRFPVPPRIQSLHDQTVRMIVRTSLGGRRVRVRLSSALGARAVRVGSAHLALRASGSGIVPVSDRALTFGGRSAVTLYAGQTVVSDPVDLDVAPLTDLAVSLYVPDSTGPPATHLFGLRPTYISTKGDLTGAREIADTARTTQSWYWLAGVDVLAPADAGVVVNFGDSITDGDQSTPDALAAWPTILAERLQRNPATRHMGVVNAGISGNRVLGDNGSGLVRLAHDALAVPGVRWITLLEGINDITGATRTPPTGPAITAADLIAAYRQIIALAHLHGVKVAGCTLTPFGGSPVYTEAGEAMRREVNQWIRTSGAFDAVIDFDAAVRDPRDPTRFRPEADAPDLLHPGDAGYRLMAEAIDLSIFTPRPR